MWAWVFPFKSSSGEATWTDFRRWLGRNRSPLAENKNMSKLFRTDVTQVVDFHCLDRFSKHQLSTKKPVRRRSSRNCFAAKVMCLLPKLSMCLGWKTLFWKSLKNPKSQLQEYPNPNSAISACSLWLSPWTFEAVFVDLIASHKQNHIYKIWFIDRT